MTNNSVVRRCGNDVVDYGYGYSPVLVESPETVLARQAPVRTIRLLDRVSQRQLYADCTRVAGGVVNTYLSHSSTPNVDSVSGIDIDMQHRVGFFGGDGGFSMSIRFNKRR